MLKIMINTAIGKFDAFSLKVIALIAMLIDHVGYSLLDENLLCDIIGRIAFPIFSFLIVESFFYTRDKKKFIIRLLIFALLSEIPFDLGIYHVLFYIYHQNVMITLLIGVLMLYFADKAQNAVLKCIIAAAFCALAWLVKCDYSYYGILIIFIFYIMRNNIVALLTGYSLTTVALRWGTTQVYSIFSFAFIAFYNGKPGPKKFKFFFYIFYPAHLIAIYCIFRIIK